MITVGEKLSVNFPVKVVQDGEIKTVVFTELLKRRAIVSIYMRNNTPSCDRQVDALAEHAREFGEMGYDLIVVSRDTVGSQKRRAGKLGMAAANLTLVSDPEDLFAKTADAVIDKQLYGRKYRGPARSAFLLEQDGTVIGVIEKVEPKGHTEQVREVMARLR